MVDMQGRLQGKRLHGPALPRRRRRARRGGLQLPARRRRRHEHRRRLRDVLVGARLRRLQPRARTSRRCAPSRGRRARRCSWPTSHWHDGSRRRRRRRGRSCAARSTASPSAAWRAFAGTELEFIVFRDTLRGGAGARATAACARPTSTTSTTRCSAPRASSRSSAASATRWPAPAWRSRTPRASATSASTRSTSTSAPSCKTADEHAIYKNGAKEIAAQEGMAITFMAKFDEREGNSCHIHLSLRRDDDDDARSPTTTALFDVVPRRPARVPARADALLRPERQLVQALPAGLVRADRGRLGHATTARARCASSATARRCAWRTARPAPTSTRTSRSPR